ncbi:MAG: SDR family oxidoreductase [bacterium]
MKKIIITGASSGLGRAAALYLDREGYSCTLIGRNRKSLEYVSERTDNSTIIEFDLVKDDYSVLLDELKQIGKFSGMVYCAGVQKNKPFQFFKESDYNEIFDVNVRALIRITNLYLSKSVIDYPNSIVFISSITAIRGYPTQSIYSASKGAVLSFARSLVSEYKKRDIRFNCILPGLFNTPMSRSIIESMKKAGKGNLPDMGEPEEFAPLVEFLLSKRSRHINGSEITLDNGESAVK